jgi:glycine cleavage system H protein
MYNIPAELRYSADHEWVEPHSPGRVRIGVSEVATDSLGEIVFIELPRVGSVISAGTVCGEIESTKSVSDLYAPVSGAILEVNDAASANPALLNEDPYGQGWLFVVEVTGEGPLLSAQEYADRNAL